MKYRGKYYKSKKNNAYVAKTPDKNFMFYPDKKAKSSQRP